MLKGVNLIAKKQLILGSDVSWGKYAGLWAFVVTCTVALLNNQVGTICIFARCTHHGSLDFDFVSFRQTLQFSNDGAGQ